jgi:hypothetical protein
MVKKGSIGIRIDETVKALVEQVAAADRRSVASYIEILIIRDLEAKGLLPKPGTKVKK